MDEASEEIDNEDDDEDEESRRRLVGGWHGLFKDVIVVINCVSTLIGVFGIC
jgi:hypothetical protein